MRKLTLAAAAGLLAALTVIPPATGSDTPTSVSISGRPHEKQAPHRLCGACSYRRGAGRLHAQSLGLDHREPFPRPSALEATWPNAQFIIRTSAAVSFRFPFVGLIFGGRTASMAARSHIADDRLRSFIDVDMLDADMLVAAVTEPTEGLYLPCISSH